jgi:anti-sigma factor ChrR (cupin superfamily)
VDSIKLHADLSRRAVVRSDELPWVASPMAGVERRMLERDGGEVARATSLVRYAPGSRFSSHVHGGGEEFLVLDGVFSDDYGDFGPGAYVRNPVGSAHAPRSPRGCTILVKLRQMDPADQDYVRIDTHARSWSAGAAPGVSVMPLHTWGSERALLQRWAPGTQIAGHGHAGGEEVFVLDGEFADALGRYGPGTWIRNPPGSAHTPVTRAGCLLYIKSGHLAGLPRQPG